VARFEYDLSRQIDLTDCLYHSNR